MAKRYWIVWLWMAAVSAACGGDEITGQAEISRDTVAGYLEPLGLNVNRAADDIALAAQNGRQYRERVTDKFSHPTTLIAWVEKQSRGKMLCLTFYRNEKCPDCNGTGQKALPAFIQGKASIALTCQRCKGTGILRNQFTKRCYLLETADFILPAARREHEEQTLPPEVNQYARQMMDDDPAKRLAACEWLDKNYIRVGMFFEDLRPALDRAQYVGRSDDKSSLAQKIFGKRIGDSGQTVYQFIASRGSPNAKSRAYYRVFIDNNSGNVVSKMFVGE
jgi:hypothetical protein